MRVTTFLILTAVCSGIGQAAAPEMWTPPELRSPDYESSPAFTPDGRELFFMRADPSFQNYRLLWSRCTKSGWSTPQPPPFALKLPVLEGDPFVTLDGRRVYFISSRQGHAEGRGNEDLDIWYSDRLPNGSWSAQPTRLPEPVNSPRSELLPRVAGDASLYFGSERAGGLGGTDIYVAKQDSSGTWSVKNLGSPINTERNEYEAEISADQSSMVLVADRGDRSHLYLFRREKDRWVEKQRLNALPHVFQVGPLLSPHGDRALFAQAYEKQSGEMFVLDLTPEPNTSWPPRCSSSLH